MVWRHGGCADFGHERESRHPLYAAGCAAGHALMAKSLATHRQGCAIDWLRSHMPDGTPGTPCCLYAALTGNRAPWDSSKHCRNDIGMYHTGICSRSCICLLSERLDCWWHITPNSSMMPGDDLAVSSDEGACTCLSHHCQAQHCCCARRKDESVLLLKSLAKQQVIKGIMMQAYLLCRQPVTRFFLLAATHWPQTVVALLASTLFH